MYLGGDGVTRDEAEARRWFARAAELGFDWEKLEP
jgi:TPR repeat protein